MYGSSSSMYNQSNMRRSGGASSTFADRSTRAGNNLPNRSSFNANSPMTMGGTYGKESTQKTETTLASAARNGVMGASSKSSISNKADILPNIL